MVQRTNFMLLTASLLAMMLIVAFLNVPGFDRVASFNLFIIATFGSFLLYRQTSGFQKSEYIQDSFDLDKIALNLGGRGFFLGLAVLGLLYGLTKAPALFNIVMDIIPLSAIGNYSGLNLSVIGFLQPIAETYFFVGVLLTFADIMPNWLAIILNGIVFSILHFSQVGAQFYSLDLEGLIQFLTHTTIYGAGGQIIQGGGLQIFMLAVMWGVLFLMFRSFFLAMGVHLVNNLGHILAVAITTTNASPLAFPGISDRVFLIPLIFFVFVIIVGLAVSKKNLLEGFTAENFVKTIILE